MKVEIRHSGPLHAIFEAPPSKSYTHRAVLAAALADGRSEIIKPLIADDTQVTRKAVEALAKVIYQTASAC